MNNINKELFTMVLKLVEAGLKPDNNVFCFVNDDRMSDQRYQDNVKLHYQGILNSLQGMSDNEKEVLNNVLHSLSYRSSCISFTVLQTVSLLSDDGCIMMNHEHLIGCDYGYNIDKNIIGIDWNCLEVPAMVLIEELGVSFAVENFTTALFRSITTGKAGTFLPKSIKVVQSISEVVKVKNVVVDASDEDDYI